MNTERPDTVVTRFIINLLKGRKHEIPPMRLKHAGFSIEERRNLRLWTSDAGYYR